MREGHDIAYRELWCGRSGAGTALVAVCVDGRRYFAERPQLESERVLPWLKEEGFAFKKLLPGVTVRSPGTTCAEPRDTVFSLGQG